jgi:hypothetical protein
MTKIYVTKYALTVGILEKEGEIDADGRYAYCGERGRIESQIFHGNDWHRTRAEAQQDTLRRIAAKRKSIQKVLDKLAKLEAEIGAHRAS